MIHRVPDSRPKIVYTGNFSVEYSTETHIRKTLNSMGYRVQCLQENATPTSKILKACSDAQLYLVTKTWGYPDGNEAGFRLLDELKNRGIPSASYHLDLFWGLQREKKMFEDPFWKTDYVFTPDGGHGDKFEKANINHIYLRPGVFKDECVLGSPRRHLSHDVVFIGSYTHYHHEEWPYRRRLVNWLKNIYKERFAIYGDAGRNVMRGRALSDLLASAKVVIGDSICFGFKQKYYWSDRIYETIGRGGFIIHPFIKGLEEEFIDKETVVFYDYGDWSSLKDKIDYYIENNREREQIKMSGYRWVKENATYHNRLEQALKVIGV